jgi:hypothetical protein
VINRNQVCLSVLRPADCFEVMAIVAGSSSTSFLLYDAGNPRTTDNSPLYTRQNPMLSQTLKRRQLSKKS